jgi:hypothetical protein
MHSAEATRIVAVPNLRRPRPSAETPSQVTRIAAPPFSGEIVPDRLCDVPAPTFNYVVQGSSLVLSSSLSPRRRIVELPFVATQAVAVDVNRALCFSRGVSFDPSERLAAPMLVLTGYDTATRSVHLVAIDMGSGATLASHTFEDEVYGPKFLRPVAEPGAAIDVNYVGRGLRLVTVGKDRVSFAMRIELGWGRGQGVVQAGTRYLRLTLPTF